MATADEKTPTTTMKENEEITEQSKKCSSLRITLLAFL